MHTTTDLRAALHHLADAAPETAPLPGEQDELLPAAKHSRHRSVAVRFGAPALAGAMVVAVVAGGVALSSRSHHAAQPGNSPTPSGTTAHVTVPAWLSETVFDVDARPGMTVGAPMVDANSQQRYLSWDGFRTDGANDADVRVWAPGRWTPSRPADAQDVTINGKPGFFGKITNQWMPVGGGKRVGLAWQYAPGAWAAVMRTKTASKADLIGLASAVRTGLHIPVRVPFRLSNLPAGWKPIRLGCSWGPYQSKGCSLMFDYDYPGWHGQVGLTVNNLAWSEGGTRTTIGGRPGWEQAGKVAIAGPGVSEAWIYVDTSERRPATNATVPQPGGVRGKGTAGGGPTNEELRSIMAGLTFASNVKDPTTWFEATTALP